MEKERVDQNSAERGDAQERRILALESNLVEQEHRPYRVLHNFFIERRSWPYGDPRRKAALSALLWRFLTPTTTAVIIGGGLITFVGVLLALHANILLGRQNRLLTVQTSLEESSRRSALVFELSAILDQIDREVGRAKGPDQAGLRLTGRTAGRIVALSRSLRPYRYLDTEEILYDTEPPEQHGFAENLAASVRGFASRFVESLAPETAESERMEIGRLSPLLSPERAQLLISVLAAGVDLSTIAPGMDLSFADLRSADLGDANLSSGKLHKAFLRTASLDKTNLSMATLTSADLEVATLVFSDLNNANLTGANLKKADLSNADLRAANLYGANLEGAKLNSADLSEANLAAANLRETNINQVQLNAACATKTTLLRTDLTLPAITPRMCNRRWGHR